MLLSSEELTQNYLNLREIVESGLAEAMGQPDPHKSKGILIDIQQHFRGLKLRHEDREELYNQLQEAFRIVNQQIDDERLAFELEADENYNHLKPLVEDAFRIAEEGTTDRAAWDELIRLREMIRASKLTREGRDELNRVVSDAFTLIKLGREEEQQLFEKESVENYRRIRDLVNEGLKQAEETHEYKETREFLKKIQAGFKGVKMKHEQREELYSRLQTAFDILNQRLNDFFHNKKKNWETRMNYTLARFDADIYNLSQSLIKDEEDLADLYDQMDILKEAGRDPVTLMTLKSRIHSTEQNIKNKKREISELTISREELRLRLEQD